MTSGSENEDLKPDTYPVLILRTYISFEHFFIFSNWFHFHQITKLANGRVEWRGVDWEGVYNLNVTN